MQMQLVHILTTLDDDIAAAAALMLGAVDPFALTRALAFVAGGGLVQLIGHTDAVSSEVPDGDDSDDDDRIIGCGWMRSQ